jgi:hypothetical protein
MATIHDNNNNDNNNDNNNNRFTNISEDGVLVGMPGGSGGYLEYIYRVAAKELFGINVEKIEYEPVKRSTDLKVTTLKVRPERK